MWLSPSRTWGKEVIIMVDVYIEREPRSRPSRRRVEKIGEGPDQSGPITLVDGSILDINMSRIHPDYNWGWGSQSKLHWPVDILSHPASKAGPTQSPYLERMTEGVTVELDDNGGGQAKLTNRRRLIVQLDRPIVNRDPAVSRYYPEYPELSGPIDYASLNRIKTEYDWVDSLSKQDIRRLEKHAHLMDYELRKGISARNREILDEESREWRRNHPGGNWI